MRRPLVLILGLLFASAAAIFAFILIGGTPTEGAATPTPADVEVLVARVDIPANTVISNTQEFFKREPVPAVQVSADRLITVGSESQVTGKKVLTALQRDQPLRSTMLGPPGLAETVPAGRRAFAIEVQTLSGIGNLISKNDRVDVLATFPLRILYVRPGFNPDAEGGLQIQLKEDITEDNTTKTILQDIQVLEILHPGPASPQGTPRAQQAAPPAAPAAQGGPTPQPTQEVPPLACTSMRDPIPNPAVAKPPATCWILIVSVTDQEAEVLKYSVDKGALINLALRSTGDRNRETTTGMTFDLIVRDQGIPLPRPLNLLRAQLEETPTLPTPGTLLTPGPSPSVTPTPSP